MQRAAQAVVGLFRDTAYKAINQEPPMTTEQKNEFKSSVAAVHRLRVNIKSLAAEARMIRHEASRAGIQYQAMLHGHRRGRLREEARYAQLALAICRGRSYKVVEGGCRIPVDETRLCDKLVRAGYCWNIGDAQPLVKKWLGRPG